MFKGLFLLVGIVLFTACNDKPRVSIKSELILPIECMRLDSIGIEKGFITHLNSLYTFNQSCNLVLKVSYKKNIVCNSSYNAQGVSKKPKSYLQLQLRKGLDVQYSYYLDLYSNVDNGNITDAFEQLEEDLIKVERKK